MTELLTAAQMRSLEQAAIQSGEVTGLELMERAGAGVVEAIYEEWPELQEGMRCAVVLCGPGNNGGDGFVVARLLKERGWEVEVFHYGDPGKLPPDAKANYDRWAKGDPVSTFDIGFFEGRSITPETSVVVDALFGTGLTRPVDLPISALSPTPELGQDHRLVAVDIPSGMCSDSGRVLVAGGGEMIAAPADLTVTFHRMKIAHILNAEDCGNCVVKDIGLEGSSRPRVGKNSPPGGAVGECPAAAPGETVSLVGPPGWALNKRFFANKYTHGHALILSGGPGKGGAARLAARGALRIGAGLVTVGTPTAALQENAGQLNAIMLRDISTAADLTETLKDNRINALCLGPGLGLDQRAKDLITAALVIPAEEPGIPDADRFRVRPWMAERKVVLDADALTILTQNPDLFSALNETHILTPHKGEFARLFPDIARRLDEEPTSGPAYSKVDATRAAAARAGCTVLYKGPDTVIASPDGTCSINSAHYDRAAPWLATAGSGDVLAGFITGLLARRFAPMQAAETGAWLHVECALKFGPGLIAEDIPEQLPAVFRDLGL